MKVPANKTQILKALLLSAAVAFAPLTLFGQGTVHFGCDNSTPIMNGLTGLRASARDGIMIALYWAAPGSSNFVQLGAAVSVGVPLPGVFVGGTRRTGPERPSAARDLFQLRAWEAAYGSTYEQAMASTGWQGRGPLNGQSAILEIPTASADPPTPPTLLTAYGFTGFQLNPAPLPRPPLNDNFENRAPLTGTNAFAVTNNESATKEPGEPDILGNSGGKSVWWTWTAPQNGTVTISTEGSGFDTLLAVYTG